MKDTDPINSIDFSGAGPPDSAIKRGAEMGVSHDAKAVSPDTNVDDEIDTDTEEENFGEIDEHEPPKDCFFNASLVLEDISAPDQTFTVSGYIECWWKDPVKVSIKTWDRKKVGKWVKFIFSKFVNRKLAKQLSKEFYNNHVDGEVLLDLTEQNLKDLGIRSVGLRKHFLKQRKKAVKANKSHLVDDQQYVLDIDHLKSPMNWEDLFYNATSEAFLTEPHHKLLNPVEENEEIGFQRMGGMAMTPGNMTPLDSRSRASSASARSPTDLEKFSEDRFDVIWGLYHIRAVLLETMELDKFPLDRQFLDVRLTCDKTETKCKFLRKRPDWVPEESEGVTIIGNDNNQIVQIRLSEKLAGAYVLEDPLVDFNSDPDSILLRLRVDRRFGYYRNNVFLPIFLIVLTAFFAYGIDPVENIAERMGVTVTIFLMVIAYQWTVSTMLPATSDDTLLNQYVTFSFLMMTAQMFQNFVVTWVIFTDDPDLLETFDKICLYTFTGIWVLFHVFFQLFHDMYRDSWDATCAQDDNQEIWLPAEGKQTMFVQKMINDASIEASLVNGDGVDVTYQTNWRTQMDCYMCLRLYFCCDTDQLNEPPPDSEAVELTNTAREQSHEKHTDDEADGDSIPNSINL